MGYRLRTSDRFEDDFDKALDYIKNTLCNPAAALRMSQRTRKIINLIKDNPYVCPLYHDDIIASKGYRYTVIGNYLLFYRINEVAKITTVDSFIHGSQNLTKILGSTSYALPGKTGTKPRLPLPKRWMRFEFLVQGFPMLQIRVQYRQCLWLMD